MSDGPDRRHAERQALEALAGSNPMPDAQILAAVQQGLESVPVGSPSAWYEVPRARRATSATTLSTRRFDAH